MQSVLQFLDKHDLTIGISWFFAVLIVDIVTDYLKFLSNRTVNHDKEGVRRFLWLLPSLVALSWSHSPNWWALAVFVLVCFMEACNFNNLFDGFLNLLRRYGWWYTGSDDKDDARTDNFYQNKPFWIQPAIKIGGSALFISVYAITY